MQSGMLEFADPAFGDFVDGYRVDEVKSFSAFAPPGDKIRLLQNSQMFRHGLPGHIQPITEFTQGLSVLLAQPIE